MESNGLVGHVMISESTKNLLEKDEVVSFNFQKYKEVEFKLNEGKIPAYLIS